MKSNFHDPIASKVPEKQKKTPWDFSQPEYDERSSCYVNAGSHYGVGHRQPVGNVGNPKSRIAALPFGRVNTMEVDDVPRKNLKQEYVD